MRDLNGVEIKDRWYKFKLYRQCFIGSDAVKWIMDSENITREAAVQLGKILVEQRIIHHVCDDHDFKDDFLFYCFYQDEVTLQPKSIRTLKIIDPNLIMDV